MKTLLNNVIDIAFSAGETALKYYGDTSFTKKEQGVLTPKDYCLKKSRYSKLKNLVLFYV